MRLAYRRFLLAYLVATKFCAGQRLMKKNKKEQCIVIDFETSSNGIELHQGDYVRNEWREHYGMTVTAVGNNGDLALQGGAARIFDTSNPSAAGRDLGSPNQGCGGPGVGSGGAPGAAGENCEALGNVIIIQDAGKGTLDDNAWGGNVYFGFKEPVSFRRIGLLNMDDDETPMLLTNDKTSFLFEIPGLGSNAVQSVTLNKEGVRSLVVTLNGSGAITFLEFCIPQSSEGNRSDGNPNNLRHHGDTKPNIFDHTQNKELTEDIAHPAPTDRTIRKLRSKN